MTQMVPAEFMVVAIDRLRDVLAAVQVDKREYALRAAVQLHNLTREAYGAGLEEFGHAARQAECEALRWGSGEDTAASRLHVARAARLLLTQLAG